VQIWTVKSVDVSKDMNTMLVLSENEGHSERDPYNLLKKDKNNLTKVLGRLESDQE